MSLDGESEGVPVGILEGASAIAADQSAVVMTGPADCFADEEAQEAEEERDDTAEGVDAQCAA
eukprot:6309706-Karenia_brevis.AAC.1